MVDGSVIAAVGGIGVNLDLRAGNGVVPVEGGEGRNAARNGGAEAARNGGAEAARVGEQDARRWGKRKKRVRDDCSQSRKRRGGGGWAENVDE